MRPLCRELTSQYDLNIKKYQYVRSNYHLDTNKGKFILRKVELSKEQIMFCYEVDTHLNRNNYTLISSIYPTKKNLPYAVAGEDIYIVQNDLLGEETDFKDIEDLKGIIGTLAQFHRSATGVESKIKDIMSIKIKNIYDYYTKRQQENNKLRKNILALKQKSNFELMFLADSEEYRKLEELALSSINREMAEELMKQVVEKATVAHKDFTYHTVTKTESKKYVIDQIDMSSYDIQLLDLAQILSKMMQKNEWNDKLLYELIETYNKQRTLSQNEFKMLKFLMTYPDKYNSICLKYISSKRRWNYNMFEQKWANMLYYKEGQMQTARRIQTW